MRALYCSLLCLLVSLMAAPSEAQLGDFLRRARDRVDEIKEEVDEVRDREEDSATGSNVPAAPSAGLSTAQMAAECEARAESDARFRTCARVCLQARNSGSQDQACRNIYTVTTTAPVSQSPGPRANAAPPALVSAEFGPSVVLDAPSARMTSIKIPAFNSLRRIGIQDSRGVSDTRKRNDMSSEVRQQLTRRENEIKIGLTSYYLLVTTSLLEPMFSSLDVSRLYLTGARGAPPEEQQRAALTMAGQQHLFALASLVTTPDKYKEYFCSSSTPQCGKSDPLFTPNVAARWGGPLGNEFEQLAAFRKWAEADYRDQVAWSAKAPREAYFVGTYSLGEYNFDRGSFEGHVRLYEGELRGNSLVARQLGFVRAADDPVKDTQPFSLKMTADEAQKLVERFDALRQPRQLYAVSKIRFEKAENPQYSGGFVLTYRAVSTSIELYLDEALQERFTTITLQ